MGTIDINDTAKWNQFCEQLLKKTIDGSIVWEDWSDRITRTEPRSALYVASYKQWNILVYRFAYKYYFDERDFEWTEGVKVELIDDQGNVEWVLPKVGSASTLLDYIQYSVADVGLLFKEIVGEDEG